MHARLERTRGWLGACGRARPANGNRTPQAGVTVARVVVDVMLKPEILDPQGQAVANALPNLGIEGVCDDPDSQEMASETDVAALVDAVDTAQSEKAGRTAGK